MSTNMGMQSPTRTVHKSQRKRRQQYFSIAVVCASNQNRSMAAHYFCKKHGYDVKSYGTGSRVKLPGKSMYAPNVYEFGTPYEFMLNDLKEKDEKFYRANGLIPMLERNCQIKRAPEKFQKSKEHFDLIVTFEDRVFEAVVESLTYRSSTVSDRMCHVINLATKDNHEEAEKASKYCYDFIKKLNAYEDWESDITSMVKSYEKKLGKRLLHAVFFT